MSGTVKEILIVRGALVRALISADRHYATAQKPELRAYYAHLQTALTCAIRTIEGCEPLIDTPVETPQEVDA
jgi:hypothetical protein